MKKQTLNPCVVLRTEKRKPLTAGERRRLRGHFDWGTNQVDWSDLSKIQGTSALGSLYLAGIAAGYEECPCSDLVDNVKKWFGLDEWGAKNGKSATLALNEKDDWSGMSFAALAGWFEIYLADGGEFQYA